MVFYKKSPGTFISVLPYPMWLLSLPVLKVIFLLITDFGQWDYNVPRDRFLNVSCAYRTYDFHWIGEHLWHLLIQSSLCFFLCPPSSMQIPIRCLVHIHQTIRSGAVSLWCPFLYFYSFYFSWFILDSFHCPAFKFMNLFMGNIWSAVHWSRAFFIPDSCVLPPRTSG